MFGHDYSEEQRPITYLGGLPIYATTLLILIYVASMIGCTLLLSSGNMELLRQLAFSSTEVLRQGKVWQFVTYVLVNPPSIAFAIDMLMLWWFGRPLEQFFGRRVFLRFYVLLLLFIPVVFTAIALFGQPMSIAGVPGQLAIFVAFATLYPNAALLFNILAKWAAAAIVALQSLIHLSANDWPQLLALWLTCGFAYLFVRRERGDLNLPTLATLRSRSKLRVLPPPAPRRRVAEESDLTTETDAVLDKIARSGKESLTPRELALLARAREALLKKDQK
jgi:membrane associated rhomboid family serine protease